AGGAAVVADFGVAKAVATARARREHPHGTLTRDGISLGTPAYMAPEQVASDPSMDHRVDLYALGIVAYEMLVGHPPFSGRSVTETMQAHLVEAPEPLAKLRPSTPSALCALVMRCLEKDPAHRPQDANEILAVLDDPAVVSGAVSSASVRSLPRAAKPSLRWWMVGAVALVAVAIGALAFRSRARGAATPVVAALLPPGVAVLPMVSISPDSSDAYLALGMTDEITSALSRVPGLRVASRSAAAAAQGAGGTVADVAARLGVPFLLEGTVQREGDRIRVAVRLVTARDGFSAWSEVYERPTGDLLAVQADIAAQIASAIRSDVTSDVAIDVTGARDPEAYNQYLRGHYLLSRALPETMADAVTAYEGAVSRDPAFARAYAELSQAYTLLPVSSGTARAEALDKATFAAQRAVALDSAMSLGYSALGAAHHLQWRWREARVALQRALTLDSTDVVALRWLALSDLVNGNAAEARRLLSRLMRRTSGESGARLQALAQVVAGDAAGALATARAEYQRDSLSSASHLLLASTLLQVGRAPEAIGVLEAIRGDDAVAPEVLGSLGYALARAGRGPEANAILEGLQRDTRRPGVYPAMARVYIGLEDRNLALDALTWATAARDEFFARESMASPIFDLVRGDPRFARVVEIVGLDAAQLASPGRVPKA
ncbi:MAG: protein kinase, partial [Gemmatimonadota bacterium]